MAQFGEFKFWPEAVAARKNLANRRRKMELMAELTFRRELYAHHTPGCVTFPAVNEVALELLSYDPPFYNELLKVWREIGASR